MKNKSFLLALVLAFALGGIALLFASCSKSAPAEKTKVGVILPLTGILAEMGQYEKQAMELAINDLQASGRKGIELIFEDGKGESKTVVAAANKLVDVDKVRLLITSTTGASLAAQPISERQQMPLLAFCMGSDVAQKSPYTIRFYIGLEEEATAIMSYLKSLPKNTRIGVLHANIAALKTVVTERYVPFLHATFSNPPLVEEYALNDKDFRAQLTKLKIAETQVLILLGFGFEYQSIFNQMQGLSMRQSLQIVGGWGFLYTQLPVETLEGIKVAGPTYVFHAGDAAHSFQEAFEKRYSAPANFDAAFAYEVVKQLPAVLKILDQNGGRNIKSGLTKWGTVEGTFGKYMFGNDGNLIAEAAMGTFRSGKIVGDQH